MTAEHTLLRTRPALLATFLAALESPSGAFVPTASDVAPGEHAVLAVDIDRARRPVVVRVLVVARRDGRGKNLPGGAYVRPVERHDPAVDTLDAFARGARRARAA